MSKVYRKHKKRVRKILDKIHFPNTIFLLRKGEGEVLWLVARFWAPDAKTGKIGMFEGRWWYLGYGIKKREIVRTAFCAVKWAMEHELMEHFRYKGKRVFNPHGKLPK